MGTKFWQMIPIGTVPINRATLYYIRPNLACAEGSFSDLAEVYFFKIGSNRGFCVLFHEMRTKCRLFDGFWVPHVYLKEPNKIFEKSEKVILFKSLANLPEKSVPILIFIVVRTIYCFQLQIFHSGFIFCPNLNPAIQIISFANFKLQCELWGVLSGESVRMRNFYAMRT
jgi:hypothetical protein